MNYPNLAAAVATRYPNANEQTRDRLCRSALHETAHLFVARIVDANPYKLRIQRSGAGWIHVHSYDEREILISARRQLPWPVDVNYPGRWKRGMRGSAFRF